jgi:DNA-binding MarR family transcriptional regulator
MDGSVSVVDLPHSEHSEEFALRTKFISNLVGYNIRRAINRITADFMRAFDGTNMRPILVSILSVVEENPGVSQGAVGEVLGVARTNMVPLMTDLEAQGLLRRTPDSVDRRALAIRLTRKGKTLLRDCNKRIRTHEERMLGGLTQDERATLMTLLGKIR